MKIGRLKSSPERPRDRQRPNVVQGGNAKTFSYYSQQRTDWSQVPSRGPKTSEERTYRDRPSKTAKGQKEPTGAVETVRKGFWVFMLTVGLVCAWKLLALQPSSRIVISNQVQVGRPVLHTSKVYAQTANMLLKQSILNRSKVTIDTQGIAKAMQAAHPELENVVVTVPLVGNRPVVYLLPAQPVMQLEAANGSYVLTTKGYAYQNQAGLDTSTLPRLIDLTGATPQRDSLFLPASTVNFMMTINYQLTQKKYAPETFMLPAGAPFEVDIRLPGKPFLVKYNLQESAAEQAGATIAVLNQLPSGVGQYIDMRVPGKAYFK